MTDFLRDNFIVTSGAGTANGRTPEVGFIAGETWKLPIGQENAVVTSIVGLIWNGDLADTTTTTPLTYGELAMVSDVSHLPRRYALDFVWQAPDYDSYLDTHSRTLLRIEILGFNRATPGTSSKLVFNVGKQYTDAPSMGAVLFRDAGATVGTSTIEFPFSQVVSGRITVIEDGASSQQAIVDFMGQTLVLPYVGEYDIRQIIIRVGYGTALRTLRMSGEMSKPPAGDIKPDNVIKAMNPAHIIFESATNREWGRGLAQSQLNTASFEACAQKLFDEGFGMCIKWGRKESIQSFVQSVLDHINAALYTDRTTALLTLKLIRNDYVKADLPLYTTANGILEIREATVSSGSVSVNEVIVTYRDPVMNEDRSVRVQNLAGIQSAGGAVNSLSKGYPGIPTSGLARRVAQRDLRASSSGLRRFTLTFDRRGNKIAPGSAIRIQDTHRNIPDMVVRVARVEYGTLLDGRVTVTAVQDVFTMPTGSFVADQPSQWTPPIFTPCVGRHEVFEVPYALLARSMTPADFNLLTDDSAYLGVVAERGQDMNASYAIAVRDSEPTEEDWPANEDAYCGYVRPAPDPGPSPEPVDGDVRLMVMVMDEEVTTAERIRVDGVVQESPSVELYAKFGDIPNKGSTVDMPNPRDGHGVTNYSRAGFMVQRFDAATETWGAFTPHFPGYSVSITGPGAGSWMTGFIGEAPDPAMGNGLFIFSLCMFDTDEPAILTVNDGTEDRIVVDLKVRAAEYAVVPYRTPRGVTGFTESEGPWSGDSFHATMNYGQIYGLTSSPSGLVNTVSTYVAVDPVTGKYTNVFPNPTTFTGTTTSHFSIPTNIRLYANTAGFVTTREGIAPTDTPAGTAVIQGPRFRVTRTHYGNEIEITSVEITNPVFENVGTVGQNNRQVVDYAFVGAMDDPWFGTPILLSIPPLTMTVSLTAGGETISQTISGA